MGSSKGSGGSVGVDGEAAATVSEGSGGSGGVDGGEAAVVSEGIEHASHVVHDLATAFDAAPFIPHR